MFNVCTLLCCAVFTEPSILADYNAKYFLYEQLCVCCPFLSFRFLISSKACPKYIQASVDAVEDVLDAKIMNRKLNGTNSSSPSSLGWQHTVLQH